MGTGMKASRMEAFSFLNFYTHLTAPRGMINVLVLEISQFDFMLDTKNAQKLKNENFKN